MGSKKTQQKKSVMRRIIVTALAVAVFSAADAQSKSANSSSYKTALGVKVWDGGGVTLKHFFNSQNAGELIAYFWRHGMRLTGLYEIHGNISGAPGLKWYIGPGAHIGFYDRGYIHRGYYYPDRRSLIGIDGVLGLDYKFKGARLIYH